MVKAVIGEETRLKLAEDRLSHSGIPSQVGLVIGKLSSALDRGFVFDLIPTPPNDAGDPACSFVETVRDDKKKGSKGKSQSESSSLFIDKDWVAEHARQVSRMLLGGMKVVGIYVWGNEGSFKNSTLVLCQTVKGVAEAAPIIDCDWDERVLIHISYSPRRWTCRNCTLASNITSSSLRPCDFKMGRVLNSLQTFRCTYNFYLRLPICHDSSSDGRSLSEILRHGISRHAKELEGAKALIDGKLVVEDEQSIADGLHEVEFLLPYMQEIMPIETMPIGAKFPKVGKIVTVLIGDLITVLNGDLIEFDDLLGEESQCVSRGTIYDAISAMIGDRLQNFKAQVDRLAIEQSLLLQNYPWHCSVRAASILEQMEMGIFVPRCARQMLKPKWGHQSVHLHHYTISLCSPTVR